MHACLTFMLLKVFRNTIMVVIAERHKVMRLFLSPRLAIHAMVHLELIPHPARLAKPAIELERLLALGLPFRRS
jgi:hypothetical protein